MRLEQLQNRIVTFGQHCLISPAGMWLCLEHLPDQG
jgi:hypothetical protein